MADTSVGSGSVIPGLDGNFSGNGIVRKDVYNDEEHSTIIQSSVNVYMHVKYLVELYKHMYCGLTSIWY